LNTFPLQSESVHQTGGTPGSAASDHRSGSIKRITSGDRLSGLMRLGHSKKAPNRCATFYQQKLESGCEETLEIAMLELHEAITLAPMIHLSRGQIISPMDELK
ncbi:MAG: hypothetical protein ACWA5A_06290, partial [Marinibacterium sp.]